MTKHYRTAGLLLVLVLTLTSCGGSTSDEGVDISPPESAPTETTSTTQPATTMPATPTTTTTATPTTTTMPSFDLTSLDDEELQSFNVTCFWATDLPRTSGGFLPSPDVDLLRLQLQVGEAAQPFLDAAEGVDLADVDALKNALGAVCNDVGAPTQEFLDGLS